MHPFRCYLYQHLGPRPRFDRRILPLQPLTTSATLSPAWSCKLALVVCCIGFPSLATADDDWLEPLRPVLQTHCASCHSGEEPSGALDLEKLGGDLSDQEAARRWILIHDRVDRGEMPPVDKTVDELPDLPTKQRANLVATISTAVTLAEQQRRDVVLRRLNRDEYERTVRDLFGAFVRVKQLLPEDNSVAGFDNVGEGLAVSAEAMQGYLRAADAALQAAWGPSQAPKKINHVTSLVDQKSFDGKPALANQYGKMFRKTKDGLVIFQSNYCPTNLVNFARLRAPVGTYRGTIRARAIQSDDAPVTLRVYGGDTIVGRREKHVVGYYDVPPEWTTIEFTDRLIEPNGTFQPKCYGTRDTRKDADTYPEPGIEIGQITIEGPLEPWPPASRLALLGDADPKSGTLEDARKVLKELLPRSFRRPIQPGESEPYLAIIQSALTEGRDFEDALRLGLKAVLCSPEFLFLDEPGRDSLGQHAIASRLSYFLWSSLPDSTLMELANQGELANDDVLRAQTERMLADPRSAAFVENFTGQWLDLRDIDFTEPDANLFPEFDELLRISMLEETHQFFRHILDEDLSVMNFVDSDFAFLNERLALHYGVTGVEGQAIRRVTLPKDSVRGGVLTQASILKVTANGTNTSPVVRGVWVLENILGQPPSPPPANVGTVEPDIRGAATLREQLAKHRQLESCAACHQKIDPPGFALESFNPIGGWRERYRTMGEGDRPEVRQAPFTYAWVRYKVGLPVDATGTTSDGKPFSDVREFKTLLLREREAVATGMAERLLTYAIGRPMGFADRNAVKQIVAASSRDDFGLRSLVHHVVQSKLFKRP